MLAFSGEVVERRVVICGKSGPVNAEITQYNHIAIKGHTGVSQLVIAETVNYAAFIHSVSLPENEILLSGTSFYREMPQKSTQAVVDDLYKTTLAGWHRQDHMIQEDENLSQTYRQKLDLAV